MTDDIPSYVPFRSRAERVAWRISMATLITLLVFMVGLWE
jgi:hypothetical protein